MLPVPASVLAEAAAGRRCPTWEVTEAFVLACGDDPARWKERWEKTHDAAGEAGRARQRGNPAPDKETVPAGPDDRRIRRHVTQQPDPWLVATAADYVRRLRALRIWAGKPGPTEIAAAARGLGRARVADSTLYDALNLKRTTLPKLNIVQIIVCSCGADVKEWTEAWKAVAMSEFEAGNPPRPHANDHPDPNGNPARFEGAGGKEDNTAGLFSPPSKVRALRVVRPREGEG